MAAGGRRHRRAARPTTRHHHRVTGWSCSAVGTAVGGARRAVRRAPVQMTAMPQLVSLFNAVGGGAAALVALAESIDRDGVGAAAPGAGASTCRRARHAHRRGHVLRLADRRRQAAGRGLRRADRVPRRRTGEHRRCSLVALAVAGWIVAAGTARCRLAAARSSLAALAFGVTMVLPIGGADMPVVISLLNAFTGTAVAMAGFVLEHMPLIIAGALVGASGGILTQLMADAMNRSMLNIIAGGFGTGDGGAAAAPAAAARSARSRRRRRDPARVRLQGHHRPRLRPGRGAGAARARRLARR